MISLANPLWRWVAVNGVSWFFISITGAAAEEIAATSLMHRLELGRARGFGAVKVRVTIGGTTWPTSVFPTKESGGYLMPVKASVRKAEGLSEGDEVALTLEIL